METLHNIICSIRRSVEMGAMKTNKLSGVRLLKSANGRK